MTFDVKSALVGLLVSAALVIAFFAVRESPAQSGGGGDANRDLIAVTGTYGSGASCLYLIDTKTRHFAVYRTENGRRLELVAARDFAYDLRLESFNDQSEAGFSPRDLRKSWTDSLRGGTTSRPAEGDTHAPPGGGR